MTGRKRKGRRRGMTVMMMKRTTATKLVMMWLLVDLCQHLSDQDLLLHRRIRGCWRTAGNKEEGHWTSSSWRS